MALRALSGEKLEKERERVSALKRYEMKLCREGGFSFVIGIDEVGRGPLCGPVVAAACVLPDDCEILFLNDSKKLSEARREALYDEIIEKALAFGIGQTDAARIDEINILNATFEAMRDAAAACMKRLRTKEEACGAFGSGTPLRTEENGTSGGTKPLRAEDCLVLVDGNRRIPGLGLPQECIVKGDASAASIAAASILAKVTRDRMMVKYDALYPGYGFAKNKGYGTDEHYNGLRAHGKTPIHRNSFLKNFSCEVSNENEELRETEALKEREEQKQENRRKTGAYYEAVAARFLGTQGYQVLFRNYRCSAGELDLIALEQETLCFIEVKYRKDSKTGMPGEAVDEKKRQRIAGAARTFLGRELIPGRLQKPEETAGARNDAFSCRGQAVSGFRFDVVEILGDKIRVIRDAFELSL